MAKRGRKPMTEKSENTNQEVQEQSEEQQPEQPQKRLEYKVVGVQFQVQTTVLNLGTFPRVASSQAVLSLDNEGIIIRSNDPRVDTIDFIPWTNVAKLSLKLENNDVQQAQA